MCAALQTPGKYGESLEGLRVILGVRPQIFNFVLPKLLKAPLLVRGQLRIWVFPGFLPYSCSDVAFCLHCGCVGKARPVVDSASLGTSRLGRLCLIAATHVLD